MTANIKTFLNDKGESVECVEIATCWPTETSVARNKKERQEAADKHNNGKLGKIGRFFNDFRGCEMWVDVDCKVWWEENFR